MAKIFIVEDEKEIRENMEILLQAEGYEVTSANDGTEAIKKMENVTPDLIISDIMMPLMDGFELYRKVKENIKTKMIPFIFLTAKSDAASLRYGMNLGADDYITKPYSTDDLLRAIKIRLERYNTINERIDEIRDSISKYVPHELRTPLVSILGYSQIILSEIESLEQNEVFDMVERINLGAKRLHNRIEKFIQLSDLEPVNKDIWFGEDSISNIDNGLIKDVIDIHYFIKERLDDIEINIEPAIIKIPGRYLKNIIKEILENAVKFSEYGKPIKTKGYKVENAFYLEVRDSGIGMSENEINRIGAFQQFRREFYQKEGNGLGLIYVKKILQIIGGNLSIESYKNQYTFVKMSIPIMQI